MRELGRHERCKHEATFPARPLTLLLLLSASKSFLRHWDLAAGQSSSLDYFSELSLWLPVHFPVQT